MFIQTQNDFKKYTYLAQINTRASLHLIMAILIICSFSLSAQNVSAKGYYKWVDQDGKTQYTETPPPANTLKPATPVQTEPKQDKKSLRDRVAAENDAAKKENPLNKKSNTTEKIVEQKQATPQSTPAPATTSSDANSEQQKKEKSYEDLKAEFIKQSCEKAQQNLQSMTDHGRVKMVKEDGKEHFLSAEEKNKKMAETNQFIGTNCKTAGKGKKKQ